MTDQLDALAAAHEPIADVMTGADRECVACHEPWPCVVSRLVRERDALREAALDAIDGFSWFVFGLLIGQERLQELAKAEALERRKPFLLDHGAGT